MKTLVFKTAWECYKKGIFGTFSEALRKAWKIEKMKKALRAGKLEFSFRKDNGEIRKAVGTLNSEMFTYEVKSAEVTPKLDVVKYWDLEAEGFRSFRIERAL